jgi:hypothetical protein
MKPTKNPENAMKIFQQVLASFTFGRKDVSITKEYSQLLESAKTDMIRNHGVKEEAITVVSVKEVEWNNGSLGCPQKGVLYTQAIVPGYTIILSDGSKNYEYHTDKSKLIIPCNKEDKTQ